MFEEQQGVCTVCGHKHKLTAHHKIRQADGGTNLPENRVGVCRPCHDRIHGIGRGCQDDCGYPNLTAAAAAVAAHWRIVQDSWDAPQRVQAGPGRGRMLPDNRFAASGYFAEQLANALEEIEPRCT